MPGVAVELLLATVSLEGTKVTYHILLLPKAHRF